MRILLAGATGFIGSRLLATLQLHGHEVWCAGRRPPPLAIGWMAVDYRRVPQVADWRPLLEGMDVVINAVGIFREDDGQTFARLHDEAPRALFSACVEAGVQRVVQLSALGVEQRCTEYQRSKHAADAFLRTLPIDGIVVQPAPVFGADGASAAHLMALAAMPLLLLPDGGRQLLQPVHVDDVVEALCNLVESPPTPGAGRTVQLVGPHALTLHDYLQLLRQGLGLAPATALPVPAPLVDLAARWGEHHAGLLDRASWTLLRQGHTGSATPITWLLGHAPRDVADFLIGEPVAALRAQARLGWQLPLARCALGLVWIVSVVLSFGARARGAGHALLSQAGIAPVLQPLLLDAAATLGLMLGVLTLWPPRRARWRARLWQAQAALMLLSMVAAGWLLPQGWLQPFGPMLTSLPMLALLGMLLVHDRDEDAPPWPLASLRPLAQGPLRGTGRDDPGRDDPPRPVRPEHRAA